MVRLKTNRWYSADGQRRRALPTGGSRRLFSLCLLLALVIALMQRVSEPKLVDNAFRTLGVPLQNELSDIELVDGESFDSEENEAANGDHRETAASNSAATNSATGSSEQDADVKRSRWLATCKDLAERIVLQADSDAVRGLAVRLFTQVESRNFNAVEPSAESVEKQSAGIGELHVAPKFSGLQDFFEATLQDAFEKTQRSKLSETEKEAWRSDLQAFTVNWQLLEQFPELRTDVDPQFFSAVAEAVDARLIADLRDGAPWSSSELATFYRLLQRTQTATEPSRNLPLISTLQLESEAGSYRGRGIRFRGTVRRMEFVPRPREDLGVDHGYWLLWLRGADESTQPVAIYTVQLDAKNLQFPVDSEQFPAVEVRGLVGKRLPYAAQSGVEVAPTLFAWQIVSLQANVAANAARKNAANSADGQDGVEQRTLPRRRANFWLVLLAACLLSALTLTPLIVQNFRRGKLRQRNSAARRSSFASRSNSLPSILVAAILSSALMATTGATVTAQPPPWASDQSDSEALAALLRDRLAGAMHGSDIQQLREATDVGKAGVPAGLLKAMDALEKFSWGRATQLLADAALAISPDENLRLKPALIRGWARAAMPVHLTEDQELWFKTEQEKGLFRVWFQTDENGVEPLKMLYCRSIPRKWTTSRQLFQPFEAEAFFVFEQTVKDDVETLCWLSQTPRWSIPAGVDATKLKPDIPSYLLDLGQLGWDLANVEIIQSHSQKSLSDAERVAFYSLQQIAADSTPHSLSTAPALPLGDSQLSDPMAVLSNSKQSVGQQVRWRVRIVNATFVNVKESDSLVLGDDHYFQFDGFVDIGDERIRYRGDPQISDAPTREFVGEFPVTIVSRNPLGFVSEASLRDGQKAWQIGKHAFVAGYFFRLWSYSSQSNGSQIRSSRQAAPLVVATELVPASAPKARHGTGFVGWFGYALCAASLGISAVIVFSIFQKNPGRRN